MRRYRFDEFLLSPRRRVLLRHGVEQPLIPRYFDLLHYLIQRRGDAVHRRDIFDHVWTDAIVSDSALSQAVRTIRRVLDDDPRNPTFVRTVARHGYQFIYLPVIEEVDASDAPPERASVAPPLSNGNAADAAGRAADTSAPALADPFAPLIERLTRIAHTPAEEEEQRDAAERLHQFGTAEALARLTGPGAARARALLRDTRWDTPLSSPVPILGAPDAAATALHVARLRIGRAAGLAAARWAAASAGGALAGTVGGAVGGLLLTSVPGSGAPLSVAPVLAVIGLGCGAVAGAGVASGMAGAEVVLRSWRTTGVVVGGALGGWLVGAAIQLESRWFLQVLTGTTPPVGGAVEGLTIGAALAAGYALSTRSISDGAPAPRGAARATVALVTSAACATAALALALSGHPLVGGSVHLIARSVSGHGLLEPLGGLIGEPDFGRVTGGLIASGEGLIFGLGVALGLTRRR